MATTGADSAQRNASRLDRRFPLAELPQALALMQSGGHFGKVAIEI